MNFIIIFVIVSGIFLALQKILPSYSSTKKISKFFYATLCISLFFVCLQWLYHNEVSNFWKYMTIISLMVYIPFALYMKQQFWEGK